MEVLRQRASEHPSQLAFTFLGNGEEESTSISLSELDRRTRAIAVRIRKHVSVGEPVLLVYPSGLEFISAFFGCLYAGAIAVPAYPPRNVRRPTDRLDSIVTDSGAQLALTNVATLERIAVTRKCNDLLASMTWLKTDECDVESAIDWKVPSINPETIALLQYTSGSTSHPKGVVVTHSNLLHNATMLRSACVPEGRSDFVGWLPMYHDMGLIGSIMQSLFVGYHSVLMSPESFLMKPSRWLSAISRYHAYGSVGPNFAYELCAQRITEKQKATLDLSCWDLAMIGAEPIRAETLRRFSDAFSDCGFRQQAFYSCYGLAEATLFVTGGKVAELPVIRSFDRAKLMTKHVVPSDDSAVGRKLVGCGKTWLEQRIVIVDTESAVECPANQIGEVCIQGPSVAGGYWKKPTATADTFTFFLSNGEGPLLRTGDLGFIYDGQLFITGRSKDVMIVAGLNHFAEDIERTVEDAHCAICCNGVAAFVVDNDLEERPVVVAELDRHAVFQARQSKDESSRILVDVTRSIRVAVSKRHEVSLCDIQLVTPSAIPKTSSGKVQRNACRILYLDNKLKTVTI